MVSSRSEILLDRVVILARHADGDQIHQAFFRLRILFENLQIERRGFVELPKQLEETALPNSAVSCAGLLRQHFVEVADRRFRLFLMQQADAEAELRFLALRIGFERLLERIGRFLPAAELFVTDAQR